MLQLTTTTDQYDEVSERKVVYKYKIALISWSVYFIFPRFDGEGPKDNKHERRRTSALTAVPPRLSPLRKHLRTASCVSSGRYSSHTICLSSYWKKDRK